MTALVSWLLVGERAESNSAYACFRLLLSLGKIGMGGRGPLVVAMCLSAGKGYKTRLLMINGEMVALRE
ncbi:unnamed protein product [Linum trigynum]|uniref:Uncharacterized protein n=1 Tax=Linum trigynum TaxID=586398 RepID=A0AAV2C8P9_9ROSI